MSLKIRGAATTALIASLVLPTAMLAAAPAAMATAPKAEAAAPKIVAAARSTDVTLNNRTATTFQRNYAKLDGGIWNNLPPETVEVGQTGKWGSESNGFATGTEGTASYQLATGEVRIHWNNPYSGGNSYSCDVPYGYTCTRDGGGGNNAHVTFTVARA